MWTPEAATFVEFWPLGWVGLVTSWVPSVWHRQRLNIHIQVTGLNDRRDRLQLSFGPLLVTLLIGPGVLFKGGTRAGISHLAAGHTQGEGFPHHCNPDNCLILNRANYRPRSTAKLFQRSGTKHGGADVLRRHLVRS